MFLINPYIYATATGSTISLTNLIAYYKFDDNTNDSYGSNNATGTSLTYNTGKYNNAAAFNGSSSRVNAADSVPLSFTNTMSVNMWVYLNAQPGAGTYMYLASKGSSNGWNLTYRDAGGVKRFENYIFADNTATNYSYENCTYTISLSAWTMLTWVVAPSLAIGSKFKMYVNGVSQSDTETNQGSGASSIYDNTADLYLGHNNAAQYTNARMDDVSIWSRTLSDTEVAILYTATTSLMY